MGAAESTPPQSGRGRTPRAAPAPAPAPTPVREVAHGSEEQQQQQQQQQQVEVVGLGLGLDVDATTERERRALQLLLESTPVAQLEPLSQPGADSDDGCGGSLGFGGDLVETEAEQEEMSADRSTRTPPPLAPILRHRTGTGTPASTSQPHAHSPAALPPSAGSEPDPDHSSSSSGSQSRSGSSGHFHGMQGLSAGVTPLRRRLSSAGSCDDWFQDDLDVGAAAVGGSGGGLHGGAVGGGGGGGGSRPGSRGGSGVNLHLQLQLQQVHLHGDGDEDSVAAAAAVTDSTNAAAGGGGSSVLSGYGQQRPVPVPAPAPAPGLNPEQGSSWGPLLSPRGIAGAGAVRRPRSSHSLLQEHRRAAGAGGRVEGAEAGAGAVASSAGAGLATTAAAAVTGAGAATGGGRDRGLSAGGRGGVGGTSLLPTLLSVFPPPAPGNLPPPDYVLESGSLTAQHLWYSTAGRRPPQPPEVKLLVEQLWARNYRKTAVDGMRTAGTGTGTGAGAGAGAGGGAGAGAGAGDKSNGAAGGEVRVEAGRLVQVVHSQQGAYSSVVAKSFHIRTLTHRNRAHRASSAADGQQQQQQQGQGQGGVDSASDSRNNSSSSSSSSSSSGSGSGGSALAPLQSSMMLSLTLQIPKFRVVRHVGFEEAGNAAAAANGSGRGSQSCCCCAPGGLHPAPHPVSSASASPDSPTLLEAYLPLPLPPACRTCCLPPTAHAEYLVVLSFGAAGSSAPVTLGFWRRHSDFRALAERLETLRIFRNSLLSWQCVVSRMKVGRCVDPAYLALKTHLLERFVHDVLFESADPGVIADFLGLGASPGGAEGEDS